MESYFLDEEDHSVDGEKLDLRRYYRAILKRWWIVLIVATAVTVPWLMYLKSQPPVYEAQALIRFKSMGATDVNLAQMRTTELTSRPFAEKVVAQLGLSLKLDKQTDRFISRSKIFKEFFTDHSPVSGHYVLRLSKDQTFSLASINEDGTRESVVESGFTEDIVDDYCQANGLSFKLVSEYDTLPAEIRFQIASFRNAVRSFQGRIRVKWEDRSYTLMNVTVTDTDPVVVTEMANRLAQLFIDESMGVGDKATQREQKILLDQLNEATSKLAGTEIQIKRFKESNSTYLESDQKNQLNQISTLERRQEQTEAIIRTLSDLLDEKEQVGFSVAADDPYKLKLRIIMSSIASHSVFDNNGTMLVAKSQLENFERDWSNIANRTSPENPRAKQGLQQILQAHSKIENIAIQEIGVLDRELSRLKKQVSNVRYRVSQRPTQELKLDELTREKEVLEKQYQDIYERYRRSQIAAASITEEIEILEGAQQPEYPTDRDKRQKAAFGGILGLIMGIGVVLVVEFLDKTIRTADDVKRFLRLPILGTIPQIDFEDTYDFQDSEKIKKIDQQLVTHDYSPTPIGEAYRSLRTNLMFTKDTGRVRTLVLTSNEPGDGKSFTAANLAITLAQLKSNTLLIDSDLRRGVLHNTFGVRKDPGFSNYLTDVVPLQRIVHETQIPNLSMISCGSLIPNPSELLGSHQMQRFLDEVRRKYDLVVFDTPPLNAATDAVVVGTQVDAVVIVIRAGKTGRDLAKSKLELFSSVPAKVLGAILNGTTADMAHPGYSYYHY